MVPDGKNTDPTTNATTKILGQIRQRLWAILGLKMAIDRLRQLGFYVVAITDDKNVATITISFNKLAVDIDSGTVNARDILETVNKIDSRIKTSEKVVATTDL